MKTPFVSLFRSVLQLVRLFPRKPSREYPSHDREGVVQMPSSLENPPALSPEQFRQMLEEALADPQMARRVLRPLLATVLPIQGGGPNENYILKFNASDQPVVTATPIFEPDGKVGIGTNDPQRLLDVRSTATAYLTIRGNNPGNDAAVLEFYDTSAAHNWQIAETDHDGTSADLRFSRGTSGAAGTEFLRIKGNTGNVGIGTRIRRQAISSM